MATAAQGLGTGHYSHFEEEKIEAQGFCHELKGDQLECSGS